MRKHFKKRHARKIVGVCLLATLFLTMLLPICAMATEETQQETVLEEELVNAASGEAALGESSAENTDNSNNNQYLSPETDNNSQNGGEGKAEIENNSFENDSDKNEEDNLISVNEGEMNDEEPQNDENHEEGDVPAEAEETDFDIQTVAIVDTVETDGRFTLSVNDAQGNVITAQQLVENGYTIAWTKNGAEVTRRKVMTNVYNMDEYFGWVNVSYDGGSAAEYTVSVSKNGVTAGTATDTVSWYGNLINNSFEEPQFSQNDSYDWVGIKQLPMASVPGWSTTASDRLIEIGNVTIKNRYGDIGTQEWYNCSTAPLGNQIAEINCTSTGALYQNVLTKPGATMYWEFSHRGRAGTDTMALVIAPYQLVKNLSEQSELEAFIKARIGDGMSAPDGYVGEDGVYIKTMSDGQSWRTYKGSITVPDDSYVTSFSFVAIDTATGDKSVGNLLDTVYFSEEIPPPIDETGTITVEKKIYDLNLNTVKENLTQSFISYNKDGQTAQITYEPNDWKVKYDDEGNEYISALYILDEISLPATYTITENKTAAQIDNYTMTTDETKITQTASITENNKIERIAFTNTYTQITDDEDQSFIIAEKRFGGITENQIPESFKITLSKDGETYELTRNSDSFLSSETLPDGSIVWRWKIDGTGTGTYGVAESGADIEGYRTTVTGVGDAVTVGAKTLTVNVLSSEETLSGLSKTVKTQDGADTLWAAVMQNGEVAVISKSPLSAGTRAAVAAQVQNISSAYSGNVLFYSIDEQLADGSFILNGSSITYDSANGNIVLSNGDAWSANASIDISVSDEESAEIAVTNSYAEAKANLTVTKTVEGKFGDKTKEFEFTYSYIDENQNGARDSFKLKHGESFLIENIPDNAVVTITENNAVGYDVSAKYGETALTVNENSVTFTIRDDGTVAFTNTKDKTPDTGVYTDNLPYILAMAIVAGGVVAMLWFKRKKREE